MTTRVLMMSALALAVTAGSAFAQESTPVAPPKTLGDEGKLPPTSTVGNKVPDMGATAPVEVGPTKRMGDQGTLPATKAMGGATPEMTAPASPPAANK